MNTEPNYNFLYKNGKLYFIKPDGEQLEISESADVSEIIAQINEEIAGLNLDLSNVKSQISRLEIVDSASGDIATFSDGADGFPVRSLTVQIDPVQDLHGYDAPWPGGSGKNKFDADTIYANYKQTDGTFLMTGAQATGIKVYAPESLVGQNLVFSAYLAIPSDSSITNLRLAAVVNGTASYSSLVSSSTFSRVSVAFTPASTTDCFYITYGSNGENNLQVKDIMLEVGSEVSDFIPYANLCPISGWTGANIARTGINLFDKSMALESGNIADDGSIGTATNYSHTDYIRVKPSTDYVTSGDVTGGSGRNAIAYYDGYKNFISRYLPSNPGGTTFTTPANCAYIRMNVYNPNVNTIQLEEGSSASAYVPYAGEDYTVDWTASAGTVYGGSDKPLTGDLTATLKSVDLGTLSWSKHSGTRCFYHELLDKETGITDVLCDTYECLENSVTSATILDYPLAIGQNNSNKIIYFYSAITEDLTTEQFKQYMSGSRLVYKLDTPLTYQHDAVSDVTTLKGQNNVWSDTGDVSVDYVADPKLYIQKEIAAI